jgi:hypothetical protein
MGASDADGGARCPVCGEGVVADIAYDAEVRGEDGEPFQAPESRQQTQYSCGHAVNEASLETADTDRLDVEQRASEDTVTRIEE